MARAVCPDCGRDVSSDAPSCPQCGRVWPGRAATSPSPAQVACKGPGYNGMSIAALVLGLIGTLPSVVAGLIAILLGIVGLTQLKAQARKQEPVQKGRWMAITGIVLRIGETVVVIGFVLRFVLSDWGA